MTAPTRTLLFLVGFRYQRGENPRVSGTPTLGATQSAVVHRLLPATSKMWSSAFARKRAMTSRRNQGAQGSINSGRLAEVLDKLVAIQLDLDPIARSGGQGIESHKIA